MASVVGVALVALSLAVPSSMLLGALGVSADDDARRLGLGATVFRIGLGLLGLYLLVAGRLPLWNGQRLPAPPAPPARRWSEALLAGIAGVALALRLHRLGEGLWYDEVVADVRYMGLSFGEILTTYNSESQHFLFTLLARAAVAVFGEGPAALRLPAALFGVASVLALYLLARRVTTDSEAILSAALLTVSYHHVWFSQNARGYTALLFWTLLSSWLLLRAVDSGRSGLWVAYAVAVALGMFTHVTMLFAVLAQAVVYAAWLIRSWATRGMAALSGAVLGFGLAAVLTFELYALVLPQFVTIIGMTTRVPEWTSPLWALQELTRGLRTGFSGSLVAVAALLVGGAGLLSYMRTAPAIVILLVVPAAGVVATAWVTGHPLWPRLFFSLMGFGALVGVRGASAVGDGIARVLRLSGPPAALSRAALALLLVLASATTVPAAWGPKQDYRGAQAFVEAHRQPGDIVVTVGLATLPYRAFYRAGWDVAASAEALAALRAGARRTWVVCTMPLHLQGQHPDLMAALRRDFTPIATFRGTLGGGAVYVYRDRDGGVAAPGGPR